MIFFINPSTNLRDIVMENTIIVTLTDIVNYLSLIVAGSVRHRSFLMVGSLHFFQIIFINFRLRRTLSILNISIIFTISIHYSILTLRVFFIMENTPTTSTVDFLSYLGSYDAPRVCHSLVIVYQFV
jgi:hypothetical protein